jgi:hypothetical protein
MAVAAKFAERLVLYAKRAKKMLNAQPRNRYMYSKAHTFIEPSAGTAVHVGVLPEGTIGLDIEPDCRIYKKPLF